MQGCDAPLRHGFDQRRAVVPPPRLRASPFAFDAGDARGASPLRRCLRRARVVAQMTQIDAALNCRAGRR